MQDGSATLYIDFCDFYNVGNAIFENRYEQHARVNLEALT